MDREGDIDGNQWGDISDADEKHLAYLTGTNEKELPDDQDRGPEASPDIEPGSELKVRLEQLNAPAMAHFARLMSAKVPAWTPDWLREQFGKARHAEIQKIRKELYRSVDYGQELIKPPGAEHRPDAKAAVGFIVEKKERRWGKKRNGKSHVKTELEIDALRRMHGYYGGEFHVRLPVSGNLLKAEPDRFSNIESEDYCGTGYGKKTIEEVKQFPLRGLSPEQHAAIAKEAERNKDSMSEIAVALIDGAIANHKLKPSKNRKRKGNKTMATKDLNIKDMPVRVARDIDRLAKLEGRSKNAVALTLIGEGLYARRLVSVLREIE